MKKQSSRDTAGGMFAVTRRDFVGGALGVSLASMIGPGVAQAQAAFDYYIGPNGNDNNPGTQAAPWAITALNSKRSTYAGKRVGLLDGTYSVYNLMMTTPSINHQTCLFNLAAGTAGSPTVVAAVNPREAIIDAGQPGTGNVPSVEGAILGQRYGSQGYVTIDGLVLRNAHGVLITFYLGGDMTLGLALPDVRGVVIKNCELYNCRNTSPGEGNNCAAISLWGTLNALVQNNRIYNVYGGNTTEHEGYGICCFTSNGNIFEYNTIYNCAVGIYCKQRNNNGHVIRYNYIECVDARATNALFECTGGSLGTTYTINNNILIAKTPWWGQGFQFPAVSGFNIYNNTVYYAGSFQTGGLFIPTNVGMVKYYNNIIARTGSTGYAGDLTLCAGATTLRDYNCYPADANGTARMGLSSITNPGAPTLYTTASSTWRAGGDASSITADPKFVGFRTLTPSGLKLQSSSPCVGAGRVGGVSNGAPTDMGAWGGTVTRIGCEFGAAGTTTPGAVQNLTVS